MKDFFNTGAATSGFLTEENFFKAMRAVWNAPPHPCSLGQHLVTLKAKERGYGVCAECGAPVGRWP